MHYNDISYSVDHGIGRITLNKPEKMNALSWGSWAELENAIAAADADAGQDLGLEPDEPVVEVPCHRAVRARRVVVMLSPGNGCLDVIPERLPRTMRMGVVGLATADIQARRQFQVEVSRSRAAHAWNP